MKVNINKILGVSDSYQAPERIMEILYDKERREKLFMELLEAYDYDVSEDLFKDYFEEEHADRKVKKQDFTPTCVAQLLSRLTMDVDNPGNYYECAAGTGSICIQHWDNFRKTYTPWDYKPQYHFAHLEELSDRAIPFLLLNLMIRGINATVLHMDTLSRKCKNGYFICNTKNDHLTFSGITNIPHTKEFEKELCVKWESEDYIDHKELMSLEDMARL